MVRACRVNIEVSALMEGHGRAQGAAHHPEFGARGPAPAEALGARRPALPGLPLRPLQPQGHCRSLHGRRWAPRALALLPPRFTRPPSSPVFCATEYSRVHDRGWSREETDLLFDFCERFDLRWPVIADRCLSRGMARSVEEMKVPHLPQQPPGAPPALTGPLARAGAVLRGDGGCAGDQGKQIVRPGPLRQQPAPVPLRPRPRGAPSQAAQQAAAARTQ